MFLQNISCVILPLCYFIPMKHCIAWHQAAPAPADGAPVPVPSGRSGRARTGKIARLPHKGTLTRPAATLSRPAGEGRVRASPHKR